MFMAAQQHMPSTITSPPAEQNWKTCCPSRARRRRSDTDNGRYGEAMAQSRRFHHQASPARTAELEFAAALLPLWGLRENAVVSLVDQQGVNNQTFLVRHRQQRYVLRVTGFLTVAEVSAEHRILRRLGQRHLPFRVPEPVAAADGQTVIETPAGAATLCRWLPGGRAGVGSGMASERLGRAVGLVDAALADVPLAVTVRDWRTDPRWVRPEDP